VGTGNPGALLNQDVHQLLQDLRGHEQGREWAVGGGRWMETKRIMVGTATTSPPPQGSSPLSNSGPLRAAALTQGSSH